MIRARGRGMALCVTAGIVVLLTGSHTPAAPASHGGDHACTGIERDDFLRKEQGDVLALVGDLKTLRSGEDLARLGTVGFDNAVFAHQQVSVRGMGWAIVSTRFLAEDPARQGHPHLLLYAPDPHSSTVTDPRDGFDFPYTLAGWAYTGPYNPTQHPTFLGPCVTRRDWFVHERGMHPFEDGGMDAVPPEEGHHGEAPGDTFPVPGIDGRTGFSHPRLWDIHLWADDDGAPSISILNPGRDIPGIDPDVGVDWFYPAPLQSFGNRGTRREPVGRKTR